MTEMTGLFALTTLYALLAGAAAGGGLALLIAAIRGLPPKTAEERARAQRRSAELAAFLGRRGTYAAIAAVPELASSRETQEAIMAATIESWSGPRQVDHGLGAIDRDGWTSSIAFMTGLDMVKEQVTTDDLVREDLLPAGE